MPNICPHKSTLFFLACFALLIGLEAAAQAQLRIAPIRPDQIGDTITCYVGGKSEELKPDKGMIRASSFSFAPNNFTLNNIETQKLFDEMTRHTGLTINIYTVPVTNNINVQICPSDGGRNYIVFSPDWLKRLYDETQNEWVLYAILAHEIGHYVLNHDRKSVGSEPHLELESDEYAGEILAKMRASLGDSQVAYRSKMIVPPKNDTHPPLQRD